MSDVKIPEGYKQTEVGVIPKDWEATTIGSVTSWLSGGTPSRSNSDFWSGSIPWISGSTLKTLEIYTSDQFLTAQGVESGSKMAPLYSTLLLVRGSALHKFIRAGLVVAPVCFNQDVKALIPNGSINPKYLTVYILAMESELLNLVSSAGNSAGVLDTELVQSFKLLLPPKPEQTAIATALSDVDNLIQSLEKLIAKKEAIKTGTMQQLLTGKTRLPEFATRDDGSAKGFKQTELGRIPEDWKVKPLGDLSIQIKSGKNTKDKFGIYPLYGSTGQIGKCKIPSYNQEAILVARVGANAGRVNFVDGKYGVSDNTIIINTNSDNSIQFIKSWLVQKDLNTLIFGSGQPLITGTQLKNLLILAPSKNEQTAIASILSDMDAEIQALQERLEKTKDIKQGMMQQLLTGKVRLLDSSAKSDTQTLASKGELQA